jgi:hypothetical protein
LGVLLQKLEYSFAELDVLFFNAVEPRLGAVLALSFLADVLSNILSNGVDDLIALDDKINQIVGPCIIN